MIEGTIALWSLLIIPTDTKNARVFGFSTNRLVMIIFLVLVSGLFLFWCIKSLRSSIFQERTIFHLDKLVDVYDLTLPFLLAACIPLVIGPYIKMLTFTPLEAIPERLSPLIFFITTRTAQSAIITFIFTLKKKLNVDRWQYFTHSSVNPY